MNLRKQVEPLLSAARQASSEQRHAHGAAPQLAWVMHWLRRASENHHEQSRSPMILAHQAVQKQTQSFFGNQLRKLPTLALPNDPSASSTRRSSRIARSLRSPLLMDC